MSDLPSLLYPPSREGSRDDWPLVVFLHGSGERGGELNAIEKYGLPHFIVGGLKLDCFVAAPHCPAELEWIDVIDQLEETLAGILSTHPISPERVALTGFSMGGFARGDGLSRIPTGSRRLLR